MRLYSRLGPLVASIKKELWVEFRYPLNFLTGVFTVFVIGSWFILSAQAFLPTNGSQIENNNDLRNFSGFAIYGLVIFLMMQNLMWSVANFVRREQIQGTLEQLYLSSGKPQIVLLGGAIGQIIVSIFFIILIILLFGLVTDLPFNNFILGFYILFITILILLGFSLISGGIILRIKRAQMILNFSQVVFIFLCAIFFPFAVLPEFIRFFAYLVPISYGVDMFRTTLMGIDPELIPTSWISPLGIDGFTLEFIILHTIAIALIIFGWKFYAKMQDSIKMKEGLSHY